MSSAGIDLHHLLTSQQGEAVHSVLLSSNTGASHFIFLLNLPSISHGVASNMFIQPESFMTRYVQDPHILYLTNLAYHITIVTSLSTKTVTSGYDVISHLT